MSEGTRPSSCFNPSCSNTGKSKCSRCQAAYYCSKVCQTKHWKEHKKECSTMQTKKADKEMRKAKKFQDDSLPDWVKDKDIRKKILNSSLLDEEWVNKINKSSPTFQKQAIDMMNGKVDISPKQQAEIDVQDYCQHFVLKKDRTYSKSLDEMLKKVEPVLKALQDKAKRLNLQPSCSGYKFMEKFTKDVERYTSVPQKDRASYSEDTVRKIETKWQMTVTEISRGIHSTLMAMRQGGSY